MVLWWVLWWTEWWCHLLFYAGDGHAVEVSDESALSCMMAFCQREDTTPHPYLWQRCPHTYTHTITHLRFWLKHTQIDPHMLCPFRLKSVSKYVPWNHCFVWREVSFFLYEFSPQPNLFKASLFSFLQQRCTSCNLILLKSESFGPINYPPTLNLQYQLLELKTYKQSMMKYCMTLVKKKIERILLSSHSGGR